MTAASAPAAPVPSITVPVTSTNVVVDQTYTAFLSAVQAFAAGVLGTFVQDPSAILTLTHGWPAWLAVAAGAGIQYIKTQYLTASNNATVNLLSSLLGKVQSSLQQQAVTQIVGAKADGTAATATGAKT
jgi:hypothetical protein